jgi:hypothetical protein
VSWVLLAVVLVLAAATAAAVLARSRWDESAADTDAEIPVVWRGYRMDQVDEVLDRLEATVADRERALGLVPTFAPPALIAPASTTGRHAPPAPVADDLPLGPDAEPDHPRPPRAARPSTRRSLSALLAGPPTSASVPLPAIRWRTDVAVFAAYLLFAVYLFAKLLAKPHVGYLDQAVQDQQLYEWFLGVDARPLTHLSAPFFTDLQNYPDGVNLMANTALLGIGLPLAPVTLLFGAWWSYVLVGIVGMAASAWAWYWLFWRRAGVTRPAALVGGWLAGFAPGMVSHANGHLNFTTLVLLPLIIDRVCALDTRNRAVRDGVLLGLLITWQVFIGEEPLLLGAIALVIVGVVLAAHGRVRVLAVGRGLLAGAATAIVLLALPLWTQFFGRQSYTSLWHPPGGNDLAALWGRATRSIGADPWASAALSMNRTEENSFFGPLLLLAALGVLVALWRRPLVRALGLLVVLACWLSLGERVVVHGKPVSAPALWAALDSLPVIENVLPTRFALMAVPALGLLLALGIDSARRQRRGVLVVAVVGALVALVPVFPTPLSAQDRPEVPSFFTGEQWRDYVKDGSVLAVPPAAIADARAFDWQLATGMSFPIVEGYFVGPNSPTDRAGRHGALRRPLSEWLWSIADEQTAKSPTPTQVKQFLDDLRAWRVDAIVLPERPETPLLLSSLQEAFGPPRHTGGVYVWDARTLRGAP